MLWHYNDDGDGGDNDGGGDDDGGNDDNKALGTVICG